MDKETVQIIKDFSDFNYLQGKNRLPDISWEDYLKEYEPSLYLMQGKNGERLKESIEQARKKAMMNAPNLDDVMEEKSMKWIGGAIDKHGNAHSLKETQNKMEKIEDIWKEYGSICRIFEKKQKLIHSHETLLDFGKTCYQKAKQGDNNVEIIKGLLKYIKNQEVLWTDDLDIIFSPDFKADDYNPPSTVTQPPTKTKN